MNTLESVNSRFSVQTLLSLAACVLLALVLNSVNASTQNFEIPAPAKEAPAYDSRLDKTMPVDEAGKNITIPGASENFALTFAAMLAAWAVLVFVVAALNRSKANSVVNSAVSEAISQARNQART